MLSFIRKNNKVLSDKIQIDTIFGILLTVLLSSFLITTLRTYTIHQTIFFILATITVIVNVYNDIVKNETKYTLLDNVLFVILFFYFIYTFRFMITSNTAVIVENLTEVVITSFKAYPFEENVIFERFNFTYSSTISNFTFWTVGFVIFYPLYGFLTRYDSRMNHTKHRTSIFGILENLTKASTADVSRTSGLTPAGRTQVIQDTLLKDVLDDRLDEIRKVEENNN